MSLDDRTVELISIGVSVGVNCQPCLQYHMAKAKELGANEQEIQQAIHAGRAVRKGAAYKMDEYIAVLYSENFSGQQAENKDCGCGCGGAC
jgi:AhpD family alkylhydroperoxidase